MRYKSSVPPSFRLAVAPAPGSPRSGLCFLGWRDRSSSVGWSGAMLETHDPHPAAFPQQLPNEPRRCLERRVDLGSIPAAGFGDLRFAAAGAAYQFGHRAYQLAGLNALDKARRDSGDESDFAFRLRRGQYHHALAKFLLQIINQSPKLAALQRVGAEGYQAHALHVYGAGEGFVQRAGCRLHAGFFQLAAEALELVFLAGQFSAEGLRRAAADRRGGKLRRDLGNSKVLAESVEGAETGDGGKAGGAGGDGPLAHNFHQANLAGGAGVRAAAKLRRKAVGQLHHSPRIPILL